MGWSQVREKDRNVFTVMVKGDHSLEEALRTGEGIYAWHQKRDGEGFTNPKDGHLDFLVKQIAGGHKVMVTGFDSGNGHNPLLVLIKLVKG